MGIQRRKIRKVCRQIRQRAKKTQEGELLECQMLLRCQEEKGGECSLDAEKRADQFIQSIFYRVRPSFSGLKNGYKITKCN